MPALLEPADFAGWLGGARATSRLQPAAEHRRRIWPVSRPVNGAGSGDDDPTLVAEVAVGDALQAGALFFNIDNNAVVLKAIPVLLRPGF